ncbi:hypothetical protein BV22DRAFT_1049801, partial [Leucogyrophana mollusca]
MDKTRGGGTTPDNPAENSRAPTPMGNASSVAIPRTRSSKAGSVIETSKGAVKDAISGKAYLEKFLLAKIGEPYTIPHIETILFNIAQLDKVPLPAQNAIRAVAYVLTEIQTDETIERITNSVVVAISPHVAKVHASSESLSKIVVDLEEAKTQVQEQQREIDKRIDSA